MLSHRSRWQLLPASNEEVVHRRVLQQHDGLGIADLAALKRCQCLIEAPFEHFQLFGFLFQAATVADFGRGVVFSDKEVQFLRPEPGLMYASNTFFTSCTR